MENVEKQQFRRALGQFATGVTVVTTLDADGEPVGITVSTWRPASRASTAAAWPGRKASKPKTCLRIRAGSS